jgi:DNA-binding NarL/FixJ family response regulator
MTRIKTLIVEDNDNFRRALRDLLQTKFPFMILEEATNGYEVLAKVASFQPEIIFLDIRLPGENGLSLTPQIKKILPAIKIIILTAHDLPEYREAAYQKGADYFLAKGTTSNSEIINLIENIISSAPGNL